MDENAALVMAREFQELLAQARKSYVTSRSKGTGLVDFMSRLSAQTEYPKLVAKVNEDLYVLERIARELDANLADRFRLKADNGWPLSPCSAACDELVGRLGAIIKLRPVLAERGPLEAAKLHPWVWTSAERLWVDGHHAEAIRAAASRILDKELPKKLGVAPGSVSVADAFSDKPGTELSPRLRFREFATDTEDWRNAHEGAKFFGMGCQKAIRNLVTHGGRRPDPEDALEMLAALSVLAQWIDETQVEPPRPPSPARSASRAVKRSPASSPPQSTA